MKHDFVAVLHFDMEHMHPKSMIPVYASLRLDKDIAARNILITKLDTTANFNLSWQYRITDYPTIQLFAYGVPMFYESKDYSLEGMKSWLLDVTATRENFNKKLVSFEDADKSKDYFVFFTAQDGGVFQRWMKGLQYKYRLVQFYDCISPEICNKISREIGLDVGILQNTIFSLRQHDKHSTTYDGQYTVQNLDDYINQSEHPDFAPFETKIFNHWLIVDRLPLAVLFFDNTNRDFHEVEAMKKFARKYRGKFVAVFANNSAKEVQEFKEAHGIRREGSFFGIFRNFSPFISKYIMKSSVTYDNLDKFIQKYKRGYIKKFLYSQDELKPLTIPSLPVSI